MKNRVAMLEGVLKINAQFEKFPTNINVDPAFRLMRFPLHGELNFYLKKIDFILIKKNDLESPLIFVLFLNGKQNKKEKP